MAGVGYHSMKCNSPLLLVCDGLMANLTPTCLSGLWLHLYIFGFALTCRLVGYCVLSLWSPLLCDQIIQLVQKIHSLTTECLAVQTQCIGILA